MSELELEQLEERKLDEELHADIEEKAMAATVAEVKAEEGIEDKEKPEAKAEDDKDGELGFTQDIDIWAPDPRTFKDRKNKEFTTHELKWSVEIKIIKKVSALIKKVLAVMPDTTQAGIEITGEGKFIYDTKRAPEFFLKTIMESIQDMPELLQDVTCALTGKDEEWVGENLTLDIMLEVVIPFFKRNLRRYVKKMNVLAQTFGS